MECEEKGEGEEQKEEDIDRARERERGGGEKQTDRQRRRQTEICFTASLGDPSMDSTDRDRTYRELSKHVAARYILTHCEASVAPSCSQREVRIAA